MKTINFTYTTTSEYLSDGSTICLDDGVTAKFQNTSVYKDGVYPPEGTRFKWDFGDGTKSNTIVWNGTNNEVSHKYTVPGEYDVTLMVWNKTLGWAYNTKKDRLIRIRDVKKPRVEIDHLPNSDLFTNQPTRFVNKSTGGIKEYRWKFRGDNKVYTKVESPIVSESRPGRFKVSLEAINERGSSFESEIIDIKEPEEKTSVVNLRDGQSIEITKQDRSELWESQYIMMMEAAARRERWNKL